MAGVDTGRHCLKCRRCLREPVSLLDQQTSFLGVGMSEVHKRLMAQIRAWKQMQDRPCGVIVKLK